MEQLTEFVSKSFASDRLMTTHPSLAGMSSRPLSPIVSSLMPTSFGTGLSFFRPPHHAIPFSTASALHSMVDRLNGGNHLSHLSAFLAPAFHATPPVDLSLLHNRRDDKSPSLSPGRVDVCSPASITDVDSRPSLDAAGNSTDFEDDAARTAGELDHNHKDCFLFRGPD